MTNEQANLKAAKLVFTFDSYTADSAGRLTLYKGSAFRHWNPAEHAADAISFSSAMIESRKIDVCTIEQDRHGVNLIIHAGEKTHVEQKIAPGRVATMLTKLLIEATSA